jgi:IMP dehydrogenase
MKMVRKVIWTPERTFNEFALLPDGLTTRECVIDKVNLSVKLHERLTLKIPLWSAAMMSVTGYHMCLELGKRGGIGILPNKLPVEEQARIVKKIKGYDLEFVKTPVVADKKETIGQVIGKIEQHGHSTIPVIDEYKKISGNLEKDWMIR